MFEDNEDLLFMHVQYQEMEDLILSLTLVVRKQNIKLFANPCELSPTPYNSKI